MSPKESAGVYPRRILMVAFHYPPCTGGSGIHRTLKFSRYLPSLGWDPAMLSAHPRAFAQTGQERLGEIPASVPVMRAFALDTGRHLSIKGRHLRWLGLPDRWASWWLGAVPCAGSFDSRCRSASSNNADSATGPSRRGAPPVVMATPAPGRSSCVSPPTPPTSAGSAPRPDPWSAPASPCRRSGRYGAR